jgi:competence protein ComEC
MPSAVLGLALMPLGLEAWPLYVMGIGIEQILATAHWFAAMKDSINTTAYYPLSALVLAVAGAFILILWRGYGKYAALPLFFISLLIAAGHQRFDVLVSPEFNLAFFIDDEGEPFISSRRTERFIAQSWEEAYGFEHKDAARWPKEGAYGPMICDSAACRAELRGAKVSFLSDIYALREECGWADVVISFVRIDDVFCDPPVFDPRDGRKNGAYGFRLAAGEVEAVSVRNVRGERPWSYQP